MAATVWKGFLTFGLISVPVRLFAAARREHVSFHMLHKTCGTRVKQQLFCPHDEKVVERSDTVKGYEVGQDTFIEIDAEELKKIELPSDRNMEIVQFVKIAEVDPLYFDASYYAVPEEPGRKAYTLLVRTLEKAGYAALAKISMHQHEYSRCTPSTILTSCTSSPSTASRSRWRFARRKSSSPSGWWRIWRRRSSRRSFATNTSRNCSI
jgi:DNA end-binding protein Ku